MFIVPIVQNERAENCPPKTAGARRGLWRVCSSNRGRGLGTSLVPSSPTPCPSPPPPLPCRVAPSAEARTVSARKNGQCKTQRGCRRRRYRFKGSISLSRWLGLGTPRCRLSGSSTQPPGWLFSSHAPRNGLRTLSRGVVAKYRHKAAISAQLFSVTGEQSGRPRRAPCGPRCSPGGVHGGRC